MSIIVGLFLALFFGTGDLKDPFPQSAAASPAAAGTAGPTGGLRDPFCEGACDEAELKEPFGTEPESGIGAAPVEATATGCSGLKDPFAETESCIEDLHEP